MIWQECYWPTISKRGDLVYMLASGLRWHLFCFVLVIIILLVMAAPAWMLWSVCGWSVLLLVHWLYVKSVTVDAAWVERRAREVQYKSYDFGHIQMIKKSYKDNSL